MLKEGQKIKILWNPKSYDYFKKRGYKNWRKNEYIYVSPNELPQNSSKEIIAICDGENCGKEINMSYKIYNKRIKKHDGKYFCLSCINKNKDFIKYRIKKKEEKRREINLNEEKIFREKTGYNPNKIVPVQLLFLNVILKEIGECGIVSFLKTKENGILINVNNFHVFIKICFKGYNKETDRDSYKLWLEKDNSVLLINIKDRLPSKENIINALGKMKPGSFMEICSKEYKDF